MKSYISDSIWPTTYASILVDDGVAQPKPITDLDVAKIVGALRFC